MSGQPDFRAVFESDLEPAVLLDGATRVVAATAGYLRATGLTREAVVGNSLFDLPPYREQPELSRRLKDVVEGVARSHLAHTVPLQGATALSPGALWAWAPTRPILSADGAMSFIVQSFQSAPGDTKAESQRERRLRKLIEHSYDAIALFGAGGRVQWVSPSIRRMLGYTEEQFAALPPLELIHPDDAAEFGQKINALFAQPGGRGVQRVRTRHVDGSWRTFEIANWNLLHDPDVAAIIANFHDITPHVELAQALERKTEHLQLALTGARAISWEVDLRDKRAAFYPDFHTFFGLPPGPITGALAIEAVHPDDREAVRANALQSIASGRDFSVEFRGRDVDGAPRWYVVNGTIVVDELGQPIRLMGIVWDATERRQLEAERAALQRQVQESQKLESLGVLAGGLAHDFNNLLTSILGNTSLIGYALPRDSGTRSQLDQIEEAARHAADLCQQMLAYAGKGRFILARVDINQLIQATAQLLRSSVSRKIALQFELDPDLTPVIADATQIRQVLMNLVINASDAIGEGGGAISICTGTARVGALPSRVDSAMGSELAPGNYAWMEVADNGPGIDEELQSRIFEPFFSTKFTGRGLGLATVLGIARGHRGGLEVRSEPGHGASFKLLLPLPLEVDKRDFTPPVSLSREPEGAATGVILVVDDEVRVRRVLCQALELMGFQVIAADNGRDALNVYRERGREIACVLMDLTMPEVDGAEAFEELRRIDPKVRVLLMSGYNEQEAVARVIGKGLAGFIQKPFDFEELQQRLRLLLG